MSVKLSSPMTNMFQYCMSDSPAASEQMKLAAVSTTEAANTVTATRYMSSTTERRMMKRKGRASSMKDRYMATTTAPMPQ